MHTFWRRKSFPKLSPFQLVLTAQNLTKVPYPLAPRLSRAGAGKIPALPGSWAVPLYGLTSEFSPGSSRQGDRHKKYWFVSNMV